MRKVANATQQMMYTIHMISNLFLNKGLGLIVLLFVIIFGLYIGGFLDILFDSEKTISINNSNRNISILDPRGISARHFTENQNPNFYVSYSANPFKPGLGLACFGSFDNLMRVMIYGPNNLIFATTTDDISALMDEVPLGQEKYGENLFSVYTLHSSSSGSKSFYLFGSSTVFKLTYNPHNCAWKEKDYSKYLDKILSSVRLVDGPLTEEELNKFNQKMQRIRESAEPEALLSSELEAGSKIQNPLTGEIKKEIDTSVANNTIINEQGCFDKVEKMDIAESSRSTIEIYCIDSIRSKMVQNQQTAPRQAYQICGKIYKVQVIPKVNNLDLIGKFASMSEKLAPHQKEVCADFNKVFAGKTIGLDLKKQQGVDYLTMYDIDDDRYVQQITMPTITLSYEWNTNAVYYFPSTLQNGDATYVGDIK